MSSITEKRGGFKVVIVGGGVAGLTLANCLERAGINYVLLEAYREFAPQVGASIAFLPGANRILDQLGVFDAMWDLTAQPFVGESLWTGEGKALIRTCVGAHLKARHGYMISFLQRREVLRILYERLEDKSKLFVNTRVVKVDHSRNGVIVRCEDGKTYAGDIVVAADGVHSVVRSEMRKYADLETNGLMDKDRKSLSAEYSCLFGISTPVPGIEVGTFQRYHGPGYSTLICGGKGSTYWFLFNKLAKRYHGDQVPSFSTEQAETQGKTFANHFVGNLKFHEFWERRTSFQMTSLEESHNDHWCSGRFVCLGDSIHKVTPNAGAGGNAAIESAATLANTLHKLLLEHHAIDSLSLSAVSEALTDFHDLRRDRVKIISKAANEFTRQEAWYGWGNKLLSLYFLPFAADLILDKGSENYVGAPSIEFLPEPKRAIGVIMPFSADHGVNKGESIWKRIFFALPFAGMLYTVNAVFGKTLQGVVPHFTKAYKTGFIQNTTSPVAVRKVYTTWRALDEFVGGRLVLAFTSSLASMDYRGHTGQAVSLFAPPSLQTISFLAELAPIITICIIEAHRRGNYFTPAKLPLVFAVFYQVYGIGFVAPIYYFLHYVFISSARYHARDNRIVRTSYAKTIIPALLVGYIVPTIAMYSPFFELSTRQALNFFWQFFPLWVALLHRIFASFIVDTTEQDMLSNVTADLRYLRTAYLFSGSFSAVAYIYTWKHSPIALRSLFLSGLTDPNAAISTSAEGRNRFLKYNYIFCFASGAWWIILSFWDLKKERKWATGWVKVLGVMGVVTIACGPGSAMAVMWAWREEVLARLD